jgi:hypothetical protein
MDASHGDDSGGYDDDDGVRSSTRYQYELLVYLYGR